MAALLIFVATYLILAIQGIPKVHIDRPTGALLGAVGMVAFGVITLPQAYQAIDLDTLLFLLGMLILIAYLELSGYFEVLERWVIGLAGSTRMLLMLIVVSSGLLSALVSNVPAVMLYVPVLEAHRGRHDLWLLLGMASTLAGNLTLIGSIANLIVVEIARDDVQISFLRYLRVGVPVTILTLSAGVLILAL